MSWLVVVMVLSPHSKKKISYFNSYTTAVPVDSHQFLLLYQYYYTLLIDYDDG